MSGTIIAPPRSKTAKWEIGDAVHVDGIRWIIRELVGRKVALASANTVNHAIWWNTTISNLPRKARA
ncbi:hypothetical protein [Microbacterium sp. A1-JK]|uniref:hypothetical protein n=1 Tax=Microbacterium sp. A1-JK TaxID=3177516 RepID=UPI0038863CCC